MSNVLISEIIDLVAKAYGVETSAILKQPHGVQVTPIAREARAVVFFLGFRHTQWTGRQITDQMGLAYNGDLLRRMADACEQITARLPQDPGFAALMEGVEQGIDSIHESREGLRAAFQTAARKRVAARFRVRPMSPIQDGEATPEWWASNDIRFRAALLDAAE